ncbi:hypothetical protein, partial [Pseudomonas rossensis]|uniref:hypothetical protein n=1 Tax=Pseudomonas rossensis TaxID=2305471 RepID=UPI0032615ACC
AIRQSPVPTRRTTPLLAEHQAVMAQLPTTLSRDQRNKISLFLRHLEQQSLSWSALAPAAGEVRPAALEAAVNTAITQHGLHPGARAAINHVFNVFLQGPSGVVRLRPVSPEHQAVMAQLPTTLSRQQRNKISRFLCHLEQQGLNWSTLAPAAGEVRPAALEAVVNTAITQHGLQTNTRAAINHAFNLVLLAPSGVVRLIPVWPEHQAVMAQLPTTLPRNQRNRISRFLCHLEQQGLSWSTLAPAAGEVRPEALEAAVNTAITQHGLDPGARAAINHAFNVVLRGPSGR